MIFVYRCYYCGLFEKEYPVGQAPAETLCIRDPSGGFVAQRYYGPETLPELGVVDPFRSYHLSTQKDRAAQEQQRPIGGPTDNFERRRIEREQGVIFTGNDISGMSAAAKRGIEKYREKAPKKLVS